MANTKKKITKKVTPKKVAVKKTTSTKSKPGKSNKKKKGFTLVELLAVIVVLAIIMIIAIPSVLKSMNNAKKGAFKIEAQKVLNTATSTYESDDMLGTFPTKVIKYPETEKIYYYSDDTEKTTHTLKGYCYTLNDLGISTSNKYLGYTVIVVDDSDTANYFLFLTDAGFSAYGLTYKQLDNTSSPKIENKKNSDIDTDCPTSIDYTEFGFTKYVAPATPVTPET